MTSTDSPTAAVPSTVGVSGFSRAVGTTSEHAYKRRCMDTDKVMFHAHLGLSTWEATHRALGEVVGALQEGGHVLDRFGLCLDRTMSLPADRRHLIEHETGPALTDDDWAAVGGQQLSQPHLGDFMIGTAASDENTAHALAHGVTTIGNLGQYFTFDVPGGGDDAEVTTSTLSALHRMAAARDHGTIVHSYLDDGPAMQLDHYAAYLGWAALESHIVETMLGARLGHCFGGLVPQPRARALLALALPHLHGPDNVGSMIYGNTVDYTRDVTHNRAVLSTYLLVDVATQLHRPTGHAVNPVPLTENIRIPDAADIIEVHLLAREIEREARRSADLFAWDDLEHEAAAGAAYARAWAAQALDVLRDDGVRVDRAYDLLLALRQTDIKRLEARIDLDPPAGLGDLEPWKARTRRALASEVIERAATRLDGRRVIIASLDVHDLARDVLVKALVTLGAEVVVLPGDSRPDAVMASAIAESADAVVVSTYNGAALRHARGLTDAQQTSGFDGPVFMGGVLNDDTGGELPADVTEQVKALGVQCVDDLRSLPALIDHHA